MSKRRLVIIGAGGHGKVVADNALKNGYIDICFLDDNASGNCMGFSIAGKCSEIEKFDDGNTDFIIAIGSNVVRKEIAEKYDVRWATLIHPSAQMAANTSVGEGSVIMAGAIVNASATVGRHCIINTGAIVEHDNKIENYVHISPGVTLGGTVHLGERTHIGIGSTVINNVNICDNCIIGAGATVIRNINEKGTYIGVPAKKLDK